ncbi:carboxymuconolactone decarboxylase family protein [Flammeovirga pectinis]|uniref:Carboxymuconolactone decarboxylase family protein n=1 Tax=Flammeovirga pectinis TaxID=2494373 RepID=A0A3S9P721_9BACT|nr:carboxymuconolactone decarboxylase family protein [Flammeovirga pectinis]AZQ63997.1 carboxymuconolactone decarboxylase family protein [Flammeovirga pectinis]
MKVLKALKLDQVDESTQEVFVAIKQKVGMLPNLYAAIGNSSELLKGFLSFASTLEAGIFTPKENEAIALAVSQENNCNYCLSAHSALGKMVGFSEEELIEIRKGEITDSKFKALIKLASELTANKGNASQESIENFLAQGYSHKALTELIGMVVLRSFTNYIFSNGDFEIDFPQVKSL